MGKTKTVFFCQNCGAQSARWLGRCNSCGEWNTFVEEVIQRDVKAKDAVRQKPADPVLITDITWTDRRRLSTNDQELDRVLGGGLVPGSLVLVGGEPGIGKSTLMLQVALRLEGKRVLYVSGEESEEQLRMRGERLGIRNGECYIHIETSIEQILQQIDKLKPDVVVIDSIQTLQTDDIDSSAGSVSQVRECAAILQRMAKTSGTPVILIGHITKEGYLAGPKVLEHVVDTVLQFEGDRNYIYRILRAAKNRFGSVSELGIYEMLGSGLREVSNPSEVLLSQRDDQLSGITIAATIEGMRPMLIETQALVSSAVYGTPQRSSTGFDVRRMNMLLAVLEKRSGFRLGIKDVFLNIAGGIKVEDPAIDLSVICAILSSNADIAVSKNVCFAAEVGLSGEIRAVNRIESRILEAEKLGFSSIYISGYNLKNLDKKKYSIDVVPCKRIEEVYSHLFG
jgi:DNA repair protein RadA/Sms